MTDAYIYRCRMCGERHQDGASSGPEVATRVLGDLVRTGGPASGICGAPVSLHATHRCASGGIGLSDLIGWEGEGDTEHERAVRYRRRGVELGRRADSLQLRRAGR